MYVYNVRRVRVEVHAFDESFRELLSAYNIASCACAPGASVPSASECDDVDNFIQPHCTCYCTAKAGKLRKASP